jgi:tripartite-type tricarboxylate transporter receptor subunit TctC
MKRALSLIGFTLLSLGFAAGVAAQAGKQLRIIVPFPPGGAADALARMVADKLPSQLGHPVIVENRPGAGGNLAAEQLARAAPDGSMLLSAPPHLLTINHMLYKLSFDLTKLVPVGIIAAYPNVLLAHPRLPASSVQELIALARQRPGELNIASQGNGTSTHLTAELFKMLAEVNMLHIPYKGTAPAFADLLGGQVDVMFDNLIAGLPHVRAGKLKLLGVGGPKRVDAFPEVPAIAETLPGFRSETWMGLVAAPGTPRAVASRLSSSLSKVLQDAEIRRRLAELQAEPVGNTPDEMAEIIRQDTERWSRVIKAANVRLD